MANALCMPALGSQGPRGMRGGSSAWPVIDAIVICSIVCANPTRSRHGPVRPNAGMRL